jgi:hypothetical protein
VSANLIPLTPRWNELTDAQREMFNLAINAVASGGEIAGDCETYTVLGDRHARAGALDAIVFRAQYR